MKKTDKNNVEFFTYLILESGEIVDLKLQVTENGNVNCSNMFLNGILYTNVFEIDCSYNKLTQLYAPFATYVNCSKNNIEELNLPQVEYLIYDIDKVKNIYAPNLKEK